MRRLAMAKPLVARRSPASTTPSAKRMATTVVPCGMSTEACCAPGACAGPASGGVVRRRSSANDGPGSNPGPKRGSGRSFIAERAYTGEISANAAEQPPEPQLATQPAHTPCVVHALQYLGRRHTPSHGSNLTAGGSRALRPRDTLRREPITRHAEILRRTPPQHLDTMQ